MAINKVTILYELRDEILEELSTLSGLPQQGVAQAARTCKNAGLLSRPMCNLLVNFDFAYNLLRHLTTMKAQNFRGKLRDDLQACAKLQNDKGKVLDPDAQVFVPGAGLVPAAPVVMHAHLEQHVSEERSAFIEKIEFGEQLLEHGENILRVTADRPIHFEQHGSSGDIVDPLEDLNEKADTELTESDAAHNCEM